jgi:hypothetical protein
LLLEPGLLPAIDAYVQAITPVDELGTFTATDLASMAAYTHIYAIIPFDEITIISATELANFMIMVVRLIIAWLIITRHAGGIDAVEF